MDTTKRLLSSGMMLTVFWLAACGNTTEPVSVPSEDARKADMPVPGDELPYSEPLVAPSGVAPVRSLLGHEIPILATGSEPFWSAEIDSRWMVFKRPGLPMIEVPLPEIAEGASPTVSFDSEGLGVSLSATGCEGASDRLKVVVTYEETAYAGCAGSGEAETDFSWEPMIKTSLAAIDGCLSEAGGERHIRALYPREAGTIGMILIDEVGHMEECGADSETGAVVFLDPVTPQQAGDWLTGPAVFSREGNGLACASSGQADRMIEGAGVFHPSGC